MADETFDSVWDAIADSPEEAVALKAKSNLMLEVVKLSYGYPGGLQQLVLTCGLAENSAFNITQWEFSKIDVFDLFKLAGALGYQVDTQLRAEEKTSTS